MLGSLGWQELLIILVIIALLFGASRIADMGSAFGKGIREFRTAVKSEDEEEAPKPASVSSPAPTKPAPPAAASDPFVDDIVRLTELHDRGVLTDEQFTAAKAKLVAGE